MPAAFRKPSVVVNSKFSTRTNANDTVYFEIVITGLAATTVDLTLSKFKDGVPKGTQAFTGTYKFVKGNSLFTASVTDTSAGFSSFKMIVKSHDASSLKDRVKLIPADPDGILQKVDNDSESLLQTIGFATSVVGAVRGSGGSSSDPEAESFVRQATPSGAQAVQNAATANYDTTAQQGTILANTVIVKKGIALVPYAFDDGANHLKLYTDGTVLPSPAGGNNTVDYGPPWRVQFVVPAGDIGDVYYVEAVRSV